jgi:hypothetical protein
MRIWQSGKDRIIRGYLAGIVIIPYDLQLLSYVHKAKQTANINDMPEVAIGPRVLPTGQEPVCL